MCFVIILKVYLINKKMDSSDDECLVNAVKDYEIKKNIDLELYNLLESLNTHKSDVGTQTHNRIHTPVKIRKVEILKKNVSCQTDSQKGEGISVATSPIPSTSKDLKRKYTKQKQIGSLKSVSDLEIDNYIKDKNINFIPYDEK